MSGPVEDGGSGPQVNAGPAPVASADWCAPCRAAAAWRELAPGATVIYPYVMLTSLLGRATLALALLQGVQGGPQIPAPRGLVNDFANVIPAASSARIERIAQDVRDKSKGEIAVVTLADLAGRDPQDVALAIGRQWKVGAMAAIGDRTRNAGVVILLVPKETSSDGHGHCRVETGQGAEGFITDATSGEICREATPAFAQRDYGTGLELVTLRVAQRYAQEFGFTLDTTLAAPEMPAAPQYSQRTRRGGSGGFNPIIIIVLVFIVLSLFGGRRQGRGGCGGGGCLPIFIPFGGGGGGGGFGGFGDGGFGGGGGGGFGGFGGGGGFSGGGGGSSW